MLNVQPIILTIAATAATGLALIYAACQILL